MGFMVMRVDAVSGGGLGGHVRGTTRMVYTEDERPSGLQGVEILVDDPAAAAAAVKAGKEARQRLRIRGRPPIHSRMQFLFAGPPPFDSEEAWDRTTTERWAHGCVDWVRETFPHATIDLAAAHWDERSPHVHVMFVPGCEDGRVSWGRLQREAAERFAGKSFGRARPAQMSALQDSCWEACGEPFGLERGQVGSTRKHRPVDHSVVDRLGRDASALERAAEKRKKAVEKRERAIEKRKRAVDRARALLVRPVRKLRKWLRRWRQRSAPPGYREVLLDSVSRLPAAGRSRGARLLARLSAMIQARDAPLLWRRPRPDGSRHRAVLAEVEAHRAARLRSSPGAKVRRSWLSTPSRAAGRTPRPGGDRDR